MGQLEKYGLYVLCLLIFLILGVTLWGSGSIQGHEKGGASSTPDLKASGTGDEALRNQDRERGGSGPSQLPSFRDLLSSEPGPDKGTANPVPPGPGPGNQPAKDPKIPPVTEKPPAPAPAERPTYTILRNDTFESIAREHFGLRSLAAEIQKVNPRLDPKKLIPGKKILMPTQAEVDALLGERLAAKVGVKVGGSYTIRRGDTLIGIAKSQLGSEQRLSEIQALNPGVNPTNLKVGSPIRLPAK